MRLVRSRLVVGAVVVAMGAAAPQPAAAVEPGAMARRTTERLSFRALSSRLLRTFAIDRFSAVNATSIRPRAPEPAALPGGRQARNGRALRARQAGHLALFAPAESERSARAQARGTPTVSETTTGRNRAPSTTAGMNESVQLQADIWQAVVGRVKKTDEVLGTDPNRALSMLKRNIETLEQMRRVPAAAAWEASGPSDPALTEVLSGPASHGAIKALLRSQLITMGKLETRLWQARRAPAPQPATVTAAAPRAVAHTASALQGLATSFGQGWSRGLARAFGMVGGDEPVSAVVRTPPVDTTAR